MPVFFQVWCEMISCIGGILFTSSEASERENSASLEFMNNGSAHLPQFTTYWDQHQTAAGQD